jgi:glycosyltransferase involved in cell wall biosynthesis
MPKISIIFPTYNNAVYLRQAIESVFSQTFQDWELIVINDGSTDNSEQTIKSFIQKDSRVIYLSHREKLGLVASLNEGINKSGGDFLARLDGDDFWTDNNKLKKQAEFLEKNLDFGLVGSWAEVITPQGKKIYELTPPAEYRKVKKEILYHNCFVHSSIVARKEAVLMAGGYNPNNRYVEDYGLWLNIGKCHKMGNLPEVMLKYRQNELGVTQTKNLEQIKGVLALIHQNRYDYPGYYKAKLKWQIQYWMVALGLAKVLTELKKVFSYIQNRKIFN